MAVHDDVEGDVDKIICQAHYRAAGWGVTPNESFDVFSGNVFIYPIIMDSKQTIIIPPLAFTNREIKKIFEGGVTPPIPSSVIDLLLRYRNLESWHPGYTVDPVDVRLMFQHGYKKSLPDKDVSATLKRILYELYCAFHQEDSIAFKRDVLTESNTHLPFVFKTTEPNCSIGSFQIRNEDFSGTVISTTELLKMLVQFSGLDPDGAVAIFTQK